MTEHDLSPFIFPSPENRENYRGAIDPLDGRYAEGEVQKFLSEEARVGYQGYVEAALAHTYADFGLCSREVALEIEAAIPHISVDEVEDRERGRGIFNVATKHDIVALDDAISARVSDEAKPWVHAAATSYDIISTANAYQYKETVKGLIIPRAVRLGDTIADLTLKNAATAQVGRTHGQHGVPITFGFATSRYLGRLGESLTLVKYSAGNLQGKFSGAVGGYNASLLLNQDPRAFEEAFLAKLGLQVCDHATQIVPAENFLRLLSEFANLHGVMAQIGEDMRNLQRSEIGEVGEDFDAENQSGSSTMVQKQNPINFEQAAGLQREIIGQLFNAYQNLVSDHQRDLRDSVSMRFYGTIPAIVARTASNLTRTLDKLKVDEGNMRRNLEMSQGRIGSEALQIVLRAAGFPNAYAIAKRLVNTSVTEGQPFGEVVVHDTALSPILEEISEDKHLAITEPEDHYLGLTPSEAMRHVIKWEETRAKLAA